MQTLLEILIDKTLLHNYTLYRYIGIWIDGSNSQISKKSDAIIFDKIAQHLGIRYAYDSDTPSNLHNFKLTADSFKVMPDSWLEQVEAAAFNLDRDLLTQLLQSIPVQHTDLKNALQRQIDDFDFDRILNLAVNSDNNWANDPLILSL